MPSMYAPVGRRASARGAAGRPCPPRGPRTKLPPPRPTAACHERRSGAGGGRPRLGGVAPLPALELGVLDRVRGLPPYHGLRRPRPGMGGRGQRDLSRRVRVDDRVRRGRLSEGELSVPALRGAVLSEVRRSPVAQGMAAQSVRSPLHALRPAQPGRRGSPPATAGGGSPLTARTRGAKPSPPFPTP